MTWSLIKKHALEVKVQATSASGDDDRRLAAQPSKATELLMGMQAHPCMLLHQYQALGNPVSFWIPLVLDSTGKGFYFRSREGT